MADFQKPRVQLIEELQALREQNSLLLAQKIEHEQTRSELELTLHDLNIHQEELRVQNEELRRARQDLEASRQNYRHLFDFAPIGYFTLNRNGQICQVNLTGAEMLGRPAASLIDKPLFLFVDENSRDDLAAHLRKILSGDEASVEVTLMGQAGHTIPVVLNTVPPDTASDGEWRCLMAAMDIAQRKQAEVALQESEVRYRDLAQENARLLEQARQDAATKTTLLNEVNHRVKNNLSAIMGLLHVEQQHFAGQHERTAYQDMVKEIIGQIRSMAVVHSLVSSAWWSAIRLDELSRQICEAATQLLSSNQTLTVQITPSPVRVSAEQANQLALVINELVTNTIKYTLAREQSSSSSSFKVSIDHEDDVVRLEFRDDGPGYPADVLSGERHNVGLHIVKSLVNRDLKGDLKLANDGGAVTSICFKMSADALPSSQQKTEPT